MEPLPRFQALCSAFGDDTRRLSEGSDKCGLIWRLKDKDDVSGNIRVIYMLQIWTVSSFYLFTLYFSRKNALWIVFNPEDRINMTNMVFF